MSLAHRPAKGPVQVRRPLGLRSAARAALLAVGLILTVGCGRSDRAEQGAAQVAKGPRPPGAATGIYPLTVTDAMGVAVTFPTAPRRIISMNPPLTETLFALGLGDRVVGVTRFCKTPPEAQQKEKIGGIIDPSMEKIISLAPDVVFCQMGNPMTIIDGLRKAGVSVFGVDPKSYAETSEMIRTIARICGVPEKAAPLVRKLEEAASYVRARTAGVAPERRPKALLVVWLDPPPLYVAGPGTFGDDMLRLCGARNAAGAQANPWKEFSLEMAVAANPDVLILTSEHMPGAGDREAKLKQLRKHPLWRGVSAVKNGRVVIVPGDLVLQTGPRLGEGLKLMAAGIHPQLFAANDSAPHHASP